MKHNEPWMRVFLLHHGCQFVFTITVSSCLWNPTEHGVHILMTRL